jgi:transcriptional antiterminator NusG
MTKKASERQKQAAPPVEEPIIPVAQAGTEDAAAAPKPEWYVIHSYSGYENKVKKNLEHRIESMGMQDKIFQVVVPTEEEIELKDGQRRIVERRVFPGYVLVQMVLDEQSWYVVRNTPNVTGFVGMGNKPTPLPDEEVKHILRQLESEEPKIKVDFKTGQKVRITEGAFAEFTGIVQELYPDKGRARVMVSFFNRDTPVDVDFLQLEKV